MSMKEGLKRAKHLLRNRIYKINDKTHMLKYIGFESKTVEVWYDSEKVKNFIENMPFKEAVAHIFGGYQFFSGKKVRFILIVDDWNTNDNWYYPSDKTWAITLKGAIETVIDTLQNQKRDVQPLKEYCIKQGLLKERM